MHAAVTHLATGVVRPLLRVVTRWAYSPQVSWVKRRRRADLVARVLTAPRGTHITQLVLGGVPTEWVVPPGADDRTLLLYLHGGGYATGSSRTHRAVAAHLAARMHAVAILPLFRLGPEHPYPAALDDAIDVYRAVLNDRIDPHRVVLAGDSAGGGLALAVALAARGSGLPLPAAIALICPWLDLDPDTPWADSRREPVLSARLLGEFAHAYAAGQHRADPAISPLHADLAGLPTLLIESAGADPLAADAHRLSERGRAAGVTVRHRHHPKLWHAFHLLAPVLPAAHDAVHLLGDDLNRVLGAPTDALSALSVPATNQHSGE